MCKKKLEKLYILWENIEKFYEDKKVLIHNLSDNTDFEQYITYFNGYESEIKNNKKDLVKGEEIIGKLSKTVEDDINNIINYLNIVQRVLGTNSMSDELKKEVIEASENKSIEQSLREFLFSIYSKKSKKY